MKHLTPLELVCRKNVEEFGLEKLLSAVQNLMGPLEGRLEDLKVESSEESWGLDYEVSRGNKLHWELGWRPFRLYPSKGSACILSVS